ncbi:MAG TPA: GNAT family protein [Candidatus Bathyarchaeia archaeon]|nr:GNAT family protein [Candidatus Bathyarchaeia archaeon]
MSSLFNVELKTQRLLLREFRENDLLRVHEYWSDPQVFQYMVGGSVDQEQTRESIRKIIAARDTNPRLDFSLAVILHETDRLIGGSRLRLLDPNLNLVYQLLGQAYVGFWLNQQYWGRGYGTEVARALLGFGFDHLHLHRIFAWCDAENIASAKVLEKIGMRREGMFMKNWMIKEQWRDAIIYATLESEWHEKNSSN